MIKYDVQFYDESFTMGMKSQCLPRVGEELWRDEDEFQEAYIVRRVAYFYDSDGEASILIDAEEDK